MTDYQVIAKLSTGQDGHIWKEEDGWYGEVSDPGDYCQGCAWGEATPEEAIAAVLRECEEILHCLKQGY